MVLCYWLTPYIHMISFPKEKEHNYTHQATTIPCSYSPKLPLVVLPQIPCHSPPAEALHKPCSQLLQLRLHEDHICRVDRQTSAGANGHTHLVPWRIQPKIASTCAAVNVACKSRGQGADVWIVNWNLEGGICLSRALAGFREVKYKKQHIEPHPQLASKILATYCNDS